MKRIATSVALVSIAGAVLASGGALKVLGGRYEVQSQCTTLGPNGYEPCGADTRDYFELSWNSEHLASFEVYSVQTNGHQCAVSGIAELQGDSLVYLDKASPDPGQGIKIQVNGNSITFSYLKPISARQLPPYCGTRAYLERIRFPLESRVHQ
jgi:hypothetical protein